MTYYVFLWDNELFSAKDIDKLHINNFIIDYSSKMDNNELFSAQNIDELLINNFIIEDSSMVDVILFSISDSISNCNI